MNFVNEQQYLSQLLKKHNREVEEHFSSLNEQHSDILKESNDQKNELLTQNRNMESRLGLLEDENASLSAQLEQLAKKADEKKHEMEEKFQWMQQEKADLEQELAVYQKTLSSHREDEGRKAKDVECLRDSMKMLAEKNKQLQKELDKMMDAAAEYAAMKQAAAMIEQENERLKNENARLKKQFVAAESRADENAHILSKASAAAAAQQEFNQGIQRQADISNVQSTPRSTLKHRTTSISSQRNHDRRPILRSSSATPRSRSSFSISSPPKEASTSRKRGILLDFTEPVDRRKLDFKVQKLSENNVKRQIDHLKSHYDPSTGAFDQSYGETPTKAAELSTPKKENKILHRILRR